MTYHAPHVESAAGELREALAEYEEAKASDAVWPEDERRLTCAAHALLAAIGEGEAR